MKGKLVAIVTLLLLATPAVSMAAGLVPCGGPDEPVCQACYAVDMLNGVLDWLVGILSVVFALIVMTAGFNLVTSSGNTSAKEKAKSMITNAIIGFVIVLAAWLGIDYGMKWLVSDEGVDIKLGTWNAVQCVKQPTVQWKLTEIEVVDTQRCFSTDDCAAKVAACNADKKNGSGSFSGSGGSLEVSCSYTRVEAQGSDGSKITPGGRGVAQCAADNTNCSIEYLKSLGLTDVQANVMSCVAVTENGGASIGESGTGPAGTFQISRTDWKRYSTQVPGCSPSDFGGNVLSAQHNASCNAKVMAKMVQSSRGYQPWTGNHKGKAPWNPYARGCVNSYSKGSDSTTRGF